MGRGVRPLRVITAFSATLPRESIGTVTEPANGALAAMNRDRCESVVETILSLGPLPGDQEEATNIDLPREVIPDFYLVLVAICHQTTPLNGPPLKGIINGHPTRGWDYLREAMLRTVAADNQWVSFARLRTIDEAGVRRAFTDDTGECVLTDCAGRAALLRDLAETMLAKGYQCTEDLYRASRGRLVAEDGNGALNLLAGVRAFDDPVQKKSNYFLAILRNHGLWKYADPEQLGPPIDYHEIRGHLRLGTVSLESNLRARIAAGEEVSSDEDVAIRRAVLDAITHIAARTGITPSQAHYFFWNVFRACCSREAPHCDGCPEGCALPERYAKLNPGTRCVFADHCPSRALARKLNEHRVVTDYY